MSTDTLQYKYSYKSDAEKIFKVLVEEQLKYFQKNDPTITCLEDGTTIDCHLTTKMQQLPVASTMEVKKIVSNKLFQTETEHPSGKIIQTYEFLTNKKGKNLLIYSEKNTFDKTKNQFGFIIVGLLYKFFYNRGIAKRLKYIDGLALDAS